MKTNYVLMLLLLVSGYTFTSSNYAIAENSSSLTNTAVESRVTVAKSSADIRGKYVGFVHKDTVTVYKHNYEVYYWNTGDFNYTQFVIMKNQQIVFDSKVAGIIIEGGTKINEKKNIWVEGIEQNNRSTFRFALEDNRPECSSIVLEEIGNKLQVTLNDDVYVEFNDVDHDGNKELLSAPYSGQIPLGPATIAIYKWENNRYVPNVAMTRQYWENTLLEREQLFKNKPSEQTLEALLSAYLLLDRLDEAVKQFPTYYQWAGQTYNDKGFVSKAFNYIHKKKYDHIDGWLEKAKPLSKQKP